MSHSREHSSKVNIGTFKVKPNGKPEVRCLITFFMDKVNSSMEILSSMDLSSMERKTFKLRGELVVQASHSETKCFSNCAKEDRRRDSFTEERTDMNKP